MHILRLRISRFRGIDSFEWKPSRGFNCLIGPGDVGKSTVLGAIALLLEPRAAPPATEYDYLDRGIEGGFEIRAVLADVAEALEGERVPPLRGWRDNDLQPMPEGDDPGVLEVAVRGSAELEVQHVIIRSDASEQTFSVTLRRKMVLARLTSGERAAGELRLGRGSLLERAVGGNEIRPILTGALAEASQNFREKLPESTQKSLDRVRERFAEHGLRGDLALGLLSPAGLSLSGMLTLVVGSDAAHAIPLAFAGLGTRQLALVTLAAQLMGDSPVIVSDEPESGLEPYRQRALVTLLHKLAGESGQVFITTHSAAVIACLNEDELWRMTPGTNPLLMKGVGAKRVRDRGPEALLARLPVLCEGDTESGFLRVVLDHYAAAEGRPSIDASGIALVGMEGHEYTIDAAEQLLDAGWELGVFVDNEDRFSGRRAALAGRAGCCMGTWTEVRNVEEALCGWLEWDRLPKIVDLAASLDGRRSVVDLLQQVGSHAGHEGRRTLEELRALTDDESAVRAALAASMGKGSWFKNERHAEALARHLLDDGGLPGAMDGILRDFWSRIRVAVG